MELQTSYAPTLPMTFPPLSPGCCTSSIHWHPHEISPDPRSDVDLDPSCGSVPWKHRRGNGPFFETVRFGPGKKEKKPPAS